MTNENRCPKCHVAGFMTRDYCRWCNELVIASELRGTQSATQSVECPDCQTPMRPAGLGVWFHCAGCAADRHISELCEQHEEANSAQVVELERAMVEERRSLFECRWPELAPPRLTLGDEFVEAAKYAMQRPYSVPRAALVTVHHPACRECGASIVQLTDGMCADCRVPLDTRIQAAQQDHDPTDEWGAWSSPTWEEP